jgi:hypothetical protein
MVHVCKENVNDQTRTKGRGSFHISTSSVKLVPMTIDSLAKKYRTPKAVQKFLRALPYNREERGETLRSARSAAELGKAHCLEAAFLAAAILERNGYPPLVLSFESVDGLDHVIYVFQENGLWGSVARSRDEGLHGRPAIYRSVRDLALSYFDPYVDKSGRITAYQLAHLDETNTDWRADRKHLWKAETYLLKLKHRPLKSSEARYRRLKNAYIKNGPMKPKKFWW